MSYKTITKSGASLVEVKRSKFMGTVRAVSSVSDAETLITGEKKKYHDAKHHCSAYIIRGKDGFPDTVHSSDDGEPSGTAGAPILEVLSGAGLKDVCLVVTRYFGGTLLGTGGLVRAYTDAAKAALEDAEISEMQLMQQFMITFDYTHTRVIDHYLGSHDLTRTDAVYTEKVAYTLAAFADDYESVKKDLVDLTGSSVKIDPMDLVYIAAGKDH
ncbi:MAG: YigZ family protein [Lachnospiraceae bacterium]|nr:YigZ family protein [Lachnospiraceae bacterium]